ncbi:hypothetical protein JCM8547_006868 [Rhodosporidiobolus lusitaniae]
MTTLTTTPSRAGSLTVSSSYKSPALSPSNLAIGAGVSLFEVTTLGQPLEVLKTHMAANRSDSLTTAIRKTYAKGGYKGFYAGLVPWAWIESSTTGGILLFTSSYVENFAMASGNVKPGAAGLLGGIAGGAAQAYLAMGVCTCMKTAEITRDKTAHVSSIPGEPKPPVPSTFGLFMDTYRKGGIRAVNKGVNAVAIRQMTNWGSRIGIARAAETVLRDLRGLRPLDSLSGTDKVLASAIGGALGTWNHPIEVVRIEMQSLVKKPSSSVSGHGSATTALAAKTKPTMLSTVKYIWEESGWRGFTKGITPRIGLSVWRTICLVSLGDHVKKMVKKSAPV